MSEGRPAALTDVKVNRSIGTTTVRSDIEKRIAVFGVAFGEHSQVILTLTDHIDPHGNRVSCVLVGWQIITSVMDAGEQGLASIVK